MDSPQIWLLNPRCHVIRILDQLLLFRQNPCRKLIDCHVDQNLEVLENHRQTG